MSESIQIAMLEQKVKELEDMRDPNPYLAAFSEKHANSLLWRVTLYQEEIALHMLQVNTSLFFSKK